MNIEQAIDFNLIEQKGFQLIKDYGANNQQFLEDFRHSNFEVYFSERLNSDHHQFKTLAHSTDLSAHPENGGFHTDFSWSDNPPAYIAMLCLEEDPKSPYFGLNQIVKSENIFNALRSIFNLTESDIFDIKVPYMIGHDIWRPVFYENFQSYPQIKFHESYIDKELACKHYIKDIPINYVLKALANQFSEVILNSKGSVLIVDNHFALHKRTESSIHFNSDGSFKSRELITVRFNK